MEKRININYIICFIGYFFMLLSCLLIIYYYYDYKYNKILVTSYFETNKFINYNSNNKVIENYLGILEIPKINLSRGFYNIESPKNNVNENIQVLDNSTFPDIENHLLVLASHSGNGKKSYFKNIYLLNNEDIINIYFNGNKYQYVIYQKYETEKIGKITINHSLTNLLVLTTCSKSDKTKQLVIIAKLNDIMPY